MLISTMNDAPGRAVTFAGGGNATATCAERTSVVREPVG